MIGRELAIVFRSRLTWISASLAALLIGHGFVLAIDLYSAGSRSAEASLLMRHRFDPLLGIVRPTLGGLYLTLSLLGPVTAARGLAVEKERRSCKPLILQTGSPYRLLFAKAAAAAIGVLIQMTAPAALLVAWWVAGGHLAMTETVVALGAYALYAILVAAIAVAAAAWTETLAQAVTVAVVVIAASWAIDASEGFAALAWLGQAIDWSVTTHLEPLERGTLAIGAVLWLLAAAIGALAIAAVGLRYDLRPGSRAIGVAAVLAAIIPVASAAHRVRIAVDVTEDRRESLPSETEAALRALSGSISLEVNLDRDDARRRQMELDALAKLRLARPDIEIRFPIDDRERPVESDRGEDYGRTTIRVGGAARETYASSDSELTKLIFEAAGAALPDESELEYPGYPLVLEGRARSLAALFAYLLLPLAILTAGAIVNRSKRRR